MTASDLFAPALVTGHYFFVDETDLKRRAVIVELGGADGGASVIIDAETSAEDADDVAKLPSLSVV